MPLDLPDHVHEQISLTAIGKRTSSPILIRRVLREAMRPVERRRNWRGNAPRTVRMTRAAEDTSLDVAS